jgi:glycosyltransferase involved in cell wall biosynthesis
MAQLRFFVMHCNLAAADGHPYTECLGWRRLCRERGIDLDVFVSVLADAQVLAATGARPLFGVTAETYARFMSLEEAESPAPPELAPLQNFMLASFDTARGCRDAWAGAAQKPDVVIFPWANAGRLNGVGEWLAELEPAERPRLVFNILRPEPSWRIDGQRREVSGDFSWFQFACRRLRSLARPGGLVFTAVEARLSQLVSRAAGVDCRPAPLHKFYPAESELAALRPTARPSGVSIGALGPSHTYEKGWDRLPEVIGRVCAAWPEAAFFVQVENRAHGEGLSAALRAIGAPARVTIQPGALPTEDYFRRLLVSDLILQPYDSPIYALMPSGIFADAVVCGTPVVAPAGTWISDRLDEGWGAGVAFDEPSAERIAEATLTAIDRLGALRARAAGQGEAWRRAHSLEAYVDHIMARLDFGEA